MSARSRIPLAALLAAGVLVASADAQTTTTSIVTTTTEAAATTSTLPVALEACQFTLTSAVSTFTHDLLRCHAKNVGRAPSKRTFKEEVCRGEKTALYDCLAPVAADAVVTGCRPAPGSCGLPGVTALRTALRDEVLAGLDADFFARLDCGDTGKGRKRAQRCVRRLSRALGDMAASVAECYVGLAETQYAQGLVSANTISTCENEERNRVLEEGGGCPACLDVAAVTDEVLALVRKTVRGAFLPCPYDTETGTFCGHVNPCRREYCDGAACTGADLTGTVCGDATACATLVCLTGVCTSRPRNEGNACDDEHPCHACVLGACTQVPSPSFCNDSNECTADACNPDSGCVHVPRIGANCTEDTDPCTDDRCGANGQCAATPVVCDDGDPNPRDFCSEGFCVFCNGTSCTQG
jgi:hypothetical protein